MKRKIGHLPKVMIINKLGKCDLVKSDESPGIDKEAAVATTAPFLPLVLAVI